MKKNFYVGVTIIALVFTFGYCIYLINFNQDDKNKLMRKSIELLDGNYLVTWSGGNINKSWKIKNGKVTSTEKGYYFFWEEIGYYIQVPINGTVIEEVK
jgi:hypothetical protein